MRRDAQTLESCYAPEAVVWHSHDCRYEPRDSNLAMLKQGMESQRKIRFRDRRIRTFEGGFVQQHRCEVTWESGFEGRMDVCFVGYVRDGMISRAYEYFDTGQVGKFLDMGTNGDTGTNGEPRSNGSGPPDSASDASGDAGG
jgi:ketosteroid isomerase-like protein